MPFSAKLLKEARGDMSQAEACNKLSAILRKAIASQQISNWERGCVNPSADTLEALAGIYGVALADFFTEAPARTGQAA